MILWRCLTSSTNLRSRRYPLKGFTMQSTAVPTTYPISPKISRSASSSLLESKKCIRDIVHQISYLNRNDHVRPLSINHETINNSSEGSTSIIKKSPMLRFANSQRETDLTAIRSTSSLMSFSYDLSASHKPSIDESTSLKSLHPSINNNEERHRETYLYISSSSSEARDEAREDIESLKACYSGRDQVKSFLPASDEAKFSTRILVNDSCEEGTETNDRESTSIDIADDETVVVDNLDDSQLDFENSSRKEIESSLPLTHISPFSTTLKTKLNDKSIQLELTETISTISLGDFPEAEFEAKHFHHHIQNDAQNVSSFPSSHKKCSMFQEDPNVESIGTLPHTRFPSAIYQRQPGLCHSHKYHRYNSDCTYGLYSNPYFDLKPTDVSMMNLLHQNQSPISPRAHTSVSTGRLQCYGHLCSTDRICGSPHLNQKPRNISIIQANQRHSSTCPCAKTSVSADLFHPFESYNHIHPLRYHTDLVRLKYEHQTGHNIMTGAAYLKDYTKPIGQCTIPHYITAEGMILSQNQYLCYTNGCCWCHHDNIHKSNGDGIGHYKIYKPPDINAPRIPCCRNRICPSSHRSLPPFHPNHKSIDTHCIDYIHHTNAVSDQSTTFTRTLPIRYISDNHHIHGNYQNRSSSSSSYSLPPFRPNDKGTETHCMNDLHHTKPVPDLFTRNVPTRHIAHNHVEDRAHLKSTVLNKGIYIPRDYTDRLKSRTVHDRTIANHHAHLSEGVSSYNSPELVRR